MKGEAVDHHDAFSTETAGLREASSSSIVRLYDGDSFELRIHPVRKRIGDAEVRMLGYNGSIPGPTLHVDQGSEITVQVANDGDVEATVHWHGLRLQNSTTSSESRTRCSRSSPRCRFCTGERSRRLPPMSVPCTLRSHPILQERVQSAG